MGQLGLRSRGGEYQTALLMKALRSVEFNTGCCHSSERVGGMCSWARTWKSYRGPDCIVTYAVLQGVCVTNLSSGINRWSSWFTYVR